MRLKLIPELISAALFVAVILPVRAQVAPAAEQGGIPVVVGAGFSDFGTDYGPAGTRMEGISAWVDFYPRGLPAVLHGLGVEAEGRDINFGRPSSLTKMRQDTAVIGPIYAWNRYRNFRPYGKFLAGVGSIDFPGTPGYTHDTFLVTTLGGGAEYRIWRNVWVRGDYEYQFWHHFFGDHSLNPEGVTIGASYDFRHIH